MAGDRARPTRDAQDVGERPARVVEVGPDPIVEVRVQGRVLVMFFLIDSRRVSSLRVSECVAVILSATLPL